MIQKSERIVRYTAAELDEKQRLFGTKTNWEAFDAITDVELEASIDHEEEGAFDLSTARAARGMPRPKQQLTVRYDPEVIEWFMARGKGYQSRMNFVLRNYVEDQKDKEKK